MSFDNDYWLIVKTINQEYRLIISSGVTAKLVVAHALLISLCTIYYAIGTFETFPEYSNTLIT